MKHLTFEAELLNEFRHVEEGNALLAAAIVMTCIEPGASEKPQNSISFCPVMKKLTGPLGKPGKEVTQAKKTASSTDVPGSVTFPHGWGLQEASFP